MNEPSEPRHVVDIEEIEPLAHVAGRSKANGGCETAARPPIRVKTAAQFCAEYAPLSYVIEGVIRTSSLYTLTAKTGAGKTGWLVAAAIAIATGRNDILGCDVSMGRVAYLAFENADDVRMRLKAASFLLKADLNFIFDRLIVVDIRAKPEDVVATLRREARNGEFALIVADTLAAFFDGKDINDNVQGGDFMRRLRPLTGLPGQPAVIVAAHPVKGAGEEQLVPYGGGAILNEVDGNLTLWRRLETSVVSLHWQGKLRGIEFKPVSFRIEVIGCPDVLDTKGRQVQLPVMLPMRLEDVEAREHAEVDSTKALLRAMVAHPNSTQREWATTIGRAVALVGKKLKTLQAEKLVERSMDRWSVTAKGRKALDVSP